MASFYIPLTGLNADSTALNTIANNLSNMNTTGYKSKSVNFSDLFYQQIGEAGSGDPIQRGSGTQVASIETDFSNGSPNTTNVDTNVALQGNGFFVVGSGNNTLLTRDGDFSLDLNGNLITSSGLSVMGFPAANGVVNANAPLAPVHIPVGEVEPPSATTTFSMTATLDSGANVGDSPVRQDSGLRFARKRLSGPGYLHQDSHQHMVIQRNAPDTLPATSTSGQLRHSR